MPMYSLIKKINSLRLHVLMGCYTREEVGDMMSNAFYNGSTWFEDDKSKPRIFNNINEAISFFTQKTTQGDRTVGQLVTFAEGDVDTWQYYTYVGADLTDINYANVDNWIYTGTAGININTTDFEVDGGGTF